MAEKKSAEDRVADLDKKIKQMQAQKRAILQREKEAARKARTKRLIRIGAEVEAYCGEITDLDAFKDYLQQYSAAIRGTQKKEQKDSPSGWFRKQYGSQRELSYRAYQNSKESRRRRSEEHSCHKCHSRRRQDYSCC